MPARDHEGRRAVRRQARAKALSKCEEAVVKSGVGTCPDGTAQTSIDKALAKMQSAIAKSCGGDDQLCGGVRDGRILTCRARLAGHPPRFRKGDYTNAIDDCGGIATCLACIDDAAVDQAMTLYYDDLVPGTQADPALNKCQVTIGKGEHQLPDLEEQGAPEVLGRAPDRQAQRRLLPGPSAGDGSSTTRPSKAADKGGGVHLQGVRRCGQASAHTPDDLDVRCRHRLRFQNARW